MRSHLWGHQAQLRRGQGPPERGGAAAAGSEEDAWLAEWPQLAPEVVLGVMQSSLSPERARAALQQPFRDENDNSNPSSHSTSTTTTATTTPFSSASSAAVAAAAAVTPPFELEDRERWR